MKRFIPLILTIIVGANAQTVGARYLIITHDRYYDAIQPLAEWKYKKGMKTKVVRLSDIGSNSTLIRNYILDAYNNWVIKPEYVLLVGSPDSLPWGQTYPYSDYPYMNMDTTFFNDILAGRLTVHDTVEAKTVVKKILLYERTPNMTDTLWLRNACLIVREDGYTYPPLPGTDDYIYWGDSRHAYGLMLDNGYNRMDTLSSLLGHNYNNVIQSVNNGVGFVQYRGQGVGNWWSPFGVNPDATSNGSMLPIVLSITCSTIGTGSTAATAERWLLTGTPANPRGASGYFATTTVRGGVAHIRSAVSRGFFTGIFVNRLRTFGEACEAGRRNLYNLYSDVTDYKGFATLGDPEMNLWTAKPRLIDVIHVESLNATEESLAVNVMLNEQPVDSALVCISLDSTAYHYGYTQNGQVIFQLDGLHAGQMDVTVTGRNLLPYEGMITIMDDNPYVLHSTYSIDDSLGNNNGIAESGETILLNNTLINIGSNPAYGVRATLRTSDAFISIIDSVSFYGNVYPQDSASSISPYVFAVSNICPDGHNVNFDLLISDAANNSWTSSLSVSITNSTSGSWVGPDAFGYYIYDDTDTLSGYAPAFEWYGGSMSLVSEITDEDADTVTYTLPFAFPFYGLTYNSIGLCSNGFMEMGASTYRFGTNEPIPSTTGPRRLIAPFWDDLDPSVSPTGTGDIYYAYDSGNNRWIVEFRSVAHYGATSQRETFQVQLRDPQYYPTPDGSGEILFLYDTVMNASSNTVGIEDNTQTIGLQYVYNGSYHPNAAPLTSGRAILITTKSPAGIWLHTTHYTMVDSVTGNGNGIIDPGETVQIYVEITNGGNSTASNISTTLRTADQDATIIDSTADFGSITPGMSAGNNANPYTVQIDAVPADTTIGFALYIESNGGEYHKFDYFTFYLYSSPGIEELTTTSDGSLNLGAYPNPFQRQVQINYVIPYERYTDAGDPVGPILKVYDVSGRLVRDLSSRISAMGHPSSITWDGTDDHGRQLANGIYFVNLECGGDRVKTKVIHVK
ncbi:MAG: T9SS type A sorting domain-containing protein [candidate division WOR-3 bacterium]|nr:MAG: T9SS type A sorting domain-containing protein [candidate division WOR-3 bacterium]